MKHILIPLAAIVLLTSCGSLLGGGAKTTSIEDLILADAFGIRIPQPAASQSQEIKNLKAELTALKESK